MTSQSTFEKLGLSLDDIIDNDERRKASMSKLTQIGNTRDNKKFKGVNKQHGMSINKRKQENGFNNKKHKINDASKRRARLTGWEAAILDSSCFYKDDGDLVVRLKNTDVVTIKQKTGKFMLDSGGWRTASTAFVIDEALKPLGLRLECVEDEGQSVWRVVDGKSYLAVFQDGMTVKHSLGRMHQLARASVIHQHMQQTKNTVKGRLAAESQPKCDQFPQYDMEPQNQAYHPYSNYYRWPPSVYEQPMQLNVQPMNYPPTCRDVHKHLFGR